MQPHVAAIDQGTTSTRCLVFDRSGQVRGWAQREHAQHCPGPGLVEHDADEILRNTERVVRDALSNARLTGQALAAVGITNQRETVVIWDRHSGKPLLNAIVWQDTRTQELCRELATAEGGADRFRQVTGLPLATYFSGPKIRWALDHVPGLRRAAERGDALCGTVDCWLVWNLTGGPRGGLHVTDVTNASRTLLMNLVSLDWDAGILDVFGIPRAMLPRIVPSSGPDVGGYTGGDGVFGRRVPISGILGDQQAALFGQCCFAPGDVKNTYGTGCFMLLNVGDRPVFSKHGLLTTVAYGCAGQSPVYALEGSVAIAGAAVQWLRDNLGIIARSDQVEALAATVPDNGDVYFVPAFAGLFAPYWRADARGVLVGLTRYANRGHLARAVLEATCYQTRDVLDAMQRDAAAPLGQLRVDGGMVGNELLMQFQADILNTQVVRPKIRETTALGAAYAAGLAVGFWASQRELSAQWLEDKHWVPAMDAVRRERLCAAWHKAVERSLNWLE